MVDERYPCGDFAGLRWQWRMGKGPDWPFVLGFGYEVVVRQ